MSVDTDDRLLMKITVAADETPELFRSLASVKDRRRRTRRLKDLATKGLMVERAGVATLTTEAAPQMAIQPPEGPGRVRSGDTGSAMLDWERS